MSWVAMAGHCGGWGMNMMEEVWRKGPWTSEEDRLLIEYVRLHGDGRWNSVARLTGLKRNGKSCRLRWVNYLRPDLKRGQITPHEEKIILELHARWGNRWSTIARSLPGRTDNEIKNYWRTHFKNKAKSSSGNSEKVKNARLLRRQQFHQQYQQQQQQQQQMHQQQVTCQAEQQSQLNHQLDVKRINSIMSLVNGSDNRVVPYVPQVRQETGTICDTNTFEGHGLLFESSMDNCYIPVHEAWNNEDFPWEGLWN